MQTTEIGRFTAMLSDVYAFYGKELSAFAGRVWTQAMGPFDLEAVADALNRHLLNPDAGQFLPKPADVVRMLDGGTQDAALLAWSKVDRALREVGAYRSVVFDDPVIHRVLTDMGGWIPLGQKTENEWPFVRNEFVNRYRGYRMRSEVPAYVPVLTGIADAQNTRTGQRSQEPILIGDAAAAERVFRSGSDQPLLAVTPRSAPVTALADAVAA
ncbi:hypothetical protein AWB76_03263 [Caballeronia temeraria]|uniref:DUF6475 domain-containing protein n=1 Tax=Caballeronia temeraria TaxID=1777137 RepID=A0A158AXN1_9BURK|nr:DUF6475 domain-containing protein [Caballeronia temeraria]SAK62535.1 hypothetical protein AWB76_03263 [Caballeronia temeraria]